MITIVVLVEDRIQNAVLTTIDSVVACKLELTIMSIKGSSGREDATTVTATPERREHIGLLPLLRTYPKRIMTTYVKYER